MSSALSTDAISLHQKRGTLGTGGPQAETSMMLSVKLDELFKEGYGRDEVFGIAIPLLMQGKIRVNRGNDTERLEIEDKDLRLQRTAAIQVFENYLLSRELESTVPTIILPHSRD